MATSSGIQLLEKFNFSRTEDCPKWIRRFERYRQASELNKDDTLQINILIYAIGHQTEDFLTFLKSTQDELKKYDTVKAKLDTRQLFCDQKKYNL